MKLYKLTDQGGCTQGPTQWRENVTHSIDKAYRSKALCSKGVLHAYKNINLALLLNPNHAGIKNPQIWEAKGKIVAEDWGKCGCWKLTTERRFDTPKWYIEKRQDVHVMFAILCAESVLCHFEKRFPEDDRPRKAIAAAKEYLKTKTDDSAYAAASAADAAASAAASAADAAYAAAHAASAADAVASAAAHAASAADAAASDAHEQVDFCKLADKAVKEIMG